jgi:threonine aldolase
MQRPAWRGYQTTRYFGKRDLLNLLGIFMQETKIIHFASDNYVGAHPEIAKIIMESIMATELPYGNDTYSKKANIELKKAFQADCESFFIGTGTASNITALKTMLRSIDCVICADIAHINGAECGALENFIGAKIFTVKSTNGKMNLNSIKEVYHSLNNNHHNKPRAISITQSTELGTVYTCEEIKEICDFAHAHNLYIHMDGSRLANAAAYLNKSLKEIVTDTGIDILSFGATKNGGLLAEAVVIFNKKLAEDFPYIQKQAMQLFSKMRIIPAQIIAYLKNDLWLANAKNANAMAKIIEEGLGNCKYLKITDPIETNQIFIELPIPLKDEILKNYYLYVTSENLNDQTCIIRVITSFNSNVDEVKKLISDFKLAEYNYSILKS